MLHHSEGSCQGEDCQLGLPPPLVVVGVGGPMHSCSALLGVVSASGSVRVAAAYGGGSAARAVKVSPLVAGVSAVLAPPCLLNNTSAAAATLAARAV